jgi:hypothetical protein
MAEMEFDREKLATSKAALPERNRQYQEQKAAWRAGTIPTHDTGTPVTRSERAKLHNVVSYDAHGKQVDAATVRALNAAEDRNAEIAATTRKPDTLDAFLERRKPVERQEPDARQTELPLKRELER